MPEPDTEALARMWDRWAPSYDEFWSGQDTTAETKFLDELAPAGGTYLDLGAGTGRLALGLAMLGNQVTCVDISPAMIERLVTKAETAGAGIVTAVANMAAYRVEQKFDCIYFGLSAFFSLTTQEDQWRCLANCRDMLAPGGHVVVEAYIPALDMLAAGTQIAVRSASEEAVRLSITQVNRAAQTLSYTEVRMTSDGNSFLRDQQRYCWPGELDAMARGVGLALASRHGGYDRSRFHSGCFMHVSVYTAG